MCSRICGAELVYEGEGIVDYEDKGSQERQPKDNFTRDTSCGAVPCWRRHARSLKKSWWRRKSSTTSIRKLRIGIKDCECNRDVMAGLRGHRWEWPFRLDMYGAVDLWAVEQPVSIGCAWARIRGPLFDPHAAFQTWKTHPFVRKIHRGRKAGRTGNSCRTGWYAMREIIGWGLIIGIQGVFWIAALKRHPPGDETECCGETISSVKAGDCS